MLSSSVRRLRDFARLPAQAPGAPVQRPQAVENRATDAKLRKCLELCVLGAVEALIRFDQSNDAGAHQVIELYLLRQSLENARGNVMHLRQFLHDHLIAFIQMGAASRCNA